MTQYPEALLSTYTDAYTATRPPSLVELNKTRVPYLEGVLEEVLRLHATSVARQAVWDTEVFAPSLSVDEKLRNKHTKANDWDESRNLSVGSSTRKGALEKMSSSSTQMQWASLGLGYLVN